MQLVPGIPVYIDSATAGAEESLWNVATVIVTANSISKLIVQRSAEIFDDGISNAHDRIGRNTVPTDVHETGIAAGVLNQPNCAVSISGDIDCWYVLHLGFMSSRGRSAACVGEYNVRRRYERVEFDESIREPIWPCNGYQS